MIEDLLEETGTEGRVSSFLLTQSITNRLLKNRIFGIYNLPLESNSTSIETNKSTIEEIFKIMSQINQIYDLKEYTDRLASYYEEISLEFYPRVTEKILTRFEGRVESISGKNVSISLIDEKTKETFIGECSIEEFEKSNIRDIYEEMKFVCEVVERGGDTIVRLKPFKRLKLSAEEINKIRKEIEEDFK